MSEQIILFGSGTIGRVIARQLLEKGIVPVMFADNDEAKWGEQVDGVYVGSPKAIQQTYPEASWIPSVLRTPYRAEIEAQLAGMGVKTQKLWDYLAVHSKPFNEIDHVLALISKDESGEETSAVLWDQYEFRKHGILEDQRPPRDISHVYFEDFFTKLPDEYFVDCGAADGDTIAEFKKRWPRFRKITAFEPDPENMEKLREATRDDARIERIQGAVSNSDRMESFSATGDQTSHLGSGEMKVRCYRLDDVMKHEKPTFLKMDIEGSEFEALLGAQQIIMKYSPVLAICAYHKPDDIWQLPLLIHALNPNYKLFLRRYLEATWELIWYAVPRERLI